MMFSVTMDSGFLQILVSLLISFPTYVKATNWANKWWTYRDFKLKSEWKFQIAHKTWHDVVHSTCFYMAPISPIYPMSLKS
jgi:hypothetical protein